MLKKSMLTAILLIAIGGYGLAAEIGNYRIPSKVDFAGTVIEPGQYGIEIVDGAEGSYIQLSQGGQVVQKDLAIVIPARGSVSRPQVQVAKIAGQEFVRIRIRQGENWYYAYMKMVR